MQVGTEPVGHSAEQMYNQLGLQTRLAVPLPDTQGDNCRSSYSMLTWHTCRLPTCLAPEPSNRNALDK